MKKIILIIFMAIISSFSYYGAVNEKGEKVVSFETTPQEENIITNQIAEETQENIINEIENTVVQLEETQQEEIEQLDTTNENTTTPIAKSKNKNNSSKNTTQTIQNTEVNEQQEIKSNTNATEKSVTTNTETTTEQNTNITSTAPKCTHSSNGWYNSKTEAEAIYNSEIKKWGDKWTNYEIDNDTYYKNCPSGYEVFSCPYCNKWTINLFY